MFSALKQESQRFFLWIPVLFAAGALIYLSLNAEPHSTLMLAFAPMVLLTRRAWRIRPAYGLSALALTILLAGFGWMQAYTRLHHTIMLQEELRFTDVQGRIIEISDVPQGYRITLDNTVIEGLSPETTPQRIRVKLRGESGEGLLTGQKIALRAGLLPPTGAVMPSGFDFARFFYFERIGAVGYAIPPVKKLSEGEENDLWLWLTRLREALSQRIRAQMSMPEGAIAAALMIGDRAAIPDDVNQIMRDTNLSHILSISGLHMALATGLVFFALRWLFAVLPATRYLSQPKKLAAVLALVAGFIYLLLSGLPVSAIRAFIMVMLVFGAILLDRQVQPMRSLALAAMLLLVYNPSYVVQPGFQLSFLATAGLIAWYESVRAAADHYFEPEQRFRRVMLYLGGILMTSLAAELATAPVVLYHFNNLSFYGMLANVLVMPLVNLMIMPAVVAAFVLMPFGLEFLALMPLELGINLMVRLARWVAAFPGAQAFWIAPTGWGIALCSFGIVWVIIWRTRWRYLGVIPALAGMASLFTVQVPDLFVSADGKQIAGRINGELVMLKGRPNSFTPEQWANGSGQYRFEKVPKDHPDWRCDKGLGCLYRAGSLRIAFPESFEAQAEDCMRAQLVITPFFLSRSECTAEVIGKRERARLGHLWFWLDESAKQPIRMGATYQKMQGRYWHPHSSATPQLDE